MKGIGDLQKAAGVAMRKHKHLFPKTKPPAADHYQYKGTIPAITCICGRSVILFDRTVVGTALEGRCEK